MRRLHLSWLTVLILLLAACAGDPAAKPFPAPPPGEGSQGGSSAPVLRPYVVGVGDSLNIAVWRFDDLKRTVIVDPAGHIQFPFAGEVRAAGLTMEQLRTELETKLAAHYVSPKVDISVGVLRSQVAHVLGEVKTPGTITLEKSTLAVEAVARAGGFTNDADEEAVLLIRDQQPEPKVYLLSLNLRSGKTSRDRGIALVSNDIIYVPPAGIVDWTRYMQRLVGILSPFMDVGRATIVSDQVYKVFRGSSGGVIVSP